MDPREHDEWSVEFRKSSRQSGVVATVRLNGEEPQRFVSTDRAFLVRKVFDFVAEHEHGETVPQGETS